MPTQVINQSIYLPNYPVAPTDIVNKGYIDDKLSRKNFFRAVERYTSISTSGLVVYSGGVADVVNNMSGYSTGQPGQTTTWQVPTGVTSIDVLVADGGNGGYRNGGGGGAGGAVKETLNVSVTPGSRLSIVVGSGGTGAWSSFGSAQSPSGGSSSSLTVGTSLISTAGATKNAGGTYSTILSKTLGKSGGTAVSPVEAGDGGGGGTTGSSGWGYNGSGGNAGVVAIRYSVAGSVNNGNLTLKNLYSQNGNPTANGTAITDPATNVWRRLNNVEIFTSSAGNDSRVTGSPFAQLNNVNTNGTYVLLQPGTYDIHAGGSLLMTETHCMSLMKFTPSKNDYTIIAPGTVCYNEIAGSYNSNVSFAGGRFTFSSAVGIALFHVFGGSYTPSKGTPTYTQLGGFPIQYIANPPDWLLRYLPTMTTAWINIEKIG